MNLSDFHYDNDRHLYDDDDDDSYDDEYEDEYDDEEDDEYFKEISRLNVSFLDSEKKNGQYIIGFRDHLTCIYCSGIVSSIFFKYSYNEILTYLFCTSIFRPYYQPTIDILQLVINDDDEYIAIRKTYWIRLIQRHWKKIFIKKQNMINKKKSISNQFSFETTGKYKKGYNVINLRIKGLLNCYSKK